MNLLTVRGGVVACCVFALTPFTVAQNPPGDKSLDIMHAQYKRIHRHALHAIDTGRAAEAVEQLVKYAEAHPDDAETHYALAVAYTKLDRLDDAWAAVRNAVELGLPPARFIAGPRTWLDDLLEHPDFESFVRRHESEIVHGPLLGSLTDRGVAVWVRTGTPSEVAIRYRQATGADRWRVAEASRSTAESDYTAVVVLDGLQPATSYEYEALINNALATQGDRLTFQTLPAAGEPAAFRVAFGGCAGFVPWYERMWHTVAAKRPDALFMLGDNVYIDHPEMPAMQQYKYYRRQSRDEWRALTSRVPVFAIYDDHDFGDDDSWGGPEIEHPAWKRPAWKLFTQNWANPAYGGGETQPGCWFDFSMADVDVFMLDGRYYRTDPENTDDAARSMLGPAQKAWLLDALGKSTATFKVLISSVAWADGTKPGSPDTWEGYARERAEIFDFIKNRRIEGIILLSSDRHRSDLWRTDYPGLYPLYEFNSGQLTNQHTHPEMKNALFSYNRKQSFGLLDFDTTKTDPSVSYTIVTIDGEHVFHHEVRRSELTFDAP